MYRKQIFNILKILVSLILLFFIFSRIDLAAFISHVHQANPWWLLTALAMMMVGVVMRAWRWRILLTSIGVIISLKELTIIYFIGFLFNNVLPSGIGGDAVRIMELNRYSQRATDATTSVLVDRFLGLSALQAIGTVALLFNWQAVPPQVAYFTVIIFGCGLVGGFLLIHRPLYLALQARLSVVRRLTKIKVIGKLFESFQSYPLAALGRAYVVSLLFNLSLIAMNISIGLALGAQASLIQYAIFVPITSIVLLVPISFAGLGMREGTYIQLFQAVGVPPEIALAMSLLVYTIGNLCTGLIGGIIYLSRSVKELGL